VGGLLHRGFSALFVGGFFGIIGIDWRVQVLFVGFFGLRGWLLVWGSWVTFCLSSLALNRDASRLE